MAKKRSRSQFWTSTGKKRYLKRNKKGRITDNQSYKKAHGQDIRREAKGER